MKPGVNEPCPCGSGKKYKKCCLHREREQTTLRPAQPALLKGLSHSAQPLLSRTSSQRLETTTAIPLEPQPPSSTMADFFRALEDDAHIHLSNPNNTSQTTPSAAWEPLGANNPRRLIPREKESDYLNPHNLADRKSVV